MGRVIFHIDMNKYYATVEQMLNPALKNKAIAVCGSSDNRHGIVLTASAEAKKSGVKTGMANWQAREACPGLIVVPPQYDQYVKYSRLARSIYRRYSDFIEPFGMDECWVDMSQLTTNYDDAHMIADEIRETMKEELGLTVSIGVSFNKIFAKLGSDMKKPDAVTMLPENNWKSHIWPLGVNELLYIGPATTRKLIGHGVVSIGQLANTPIEHLHSWFGVNGDMLWRFANGLDTSRVCPDGYSNEIKSVGHGITCTRDLENIENVWRVMLELAQDIGRRLQLYGYAANGVRLVVRQNDLCWNQWQMKRKTATRSPMEIARDCMSLFEKNYQWFYSVRSLTLTATNLVPDNTPVQEDIFGDSERAEKRRKADDCIIEIRNRFGANIIRSASLFGDLYMPSDGRDEVQMPGMMYK